MQGVGELSPSSKSPLQNPGAFSHRSTRRVSKKLSQSPEVLAGAWKLSYMTVRSSRASTTSPNRKQCRKWGKEGDMVG